MGDFEVLSKELKREPEEGLVLVAVSLVFEVLRTWRHAYKNEVGIRIQLRGNVVRHVVVEDAGLSCGKSTRRDFVKRFLSSDATDAFDSAREHRTTALSLIRVMSL